MYFWQEFFHTNKYGYQPIHLAAVNGQAEIVELLVEKGAKLDVITSTGKMPMHLAAGGGFPEVRIITQCSETESLCLDCLALAFGFTSVNLQVVAAICGCVRNNPECVDTIQRVALKNRLKLFERPGDMDKLVKKVCMMKVLSSVRCHV